MENQENKQKAINFKSHILLPVIFIITLVLSIMFAAVDGFTDDLSPLVIYFFFAVGLFYNITAIIDAKMSEEKSKKTKTFIYIMSILTAISSILYLVFYLLNK